MKKKDFNNIINVIHGSWPQTLSVDRMSILSAIHGMDTMLTHQQYDNQNYHLQGFQSLLGTYIENKYRIYFNNIERKINCYAINNQLDWRAAFLKLVNELGSAITWTESGHASIESKSMFNMELTLKEHIYDLENYTTFSGEVIEVGMHIQLNDKMLDHYKKTRHYDPTIEAPNWDIFIPSDLSFKNVKFLFYFENWLGQITGKQHWIFDNVPAIYSLSKSTVKAIKREDKKTFVYTEYFEIEIESALENNEVIIKGQKINSNEDWQNKNLTALKLFFDEFNFFSYQDLKDRDFFNYIGPRMNASFKDRKTEFHDYNYQRYFMGGRNIEDRMKLEVEIPILERIEIEKEKPKHPLKEDWFLPRENYIISENDTLIELSKVKPNIKQLRIHLEKMVSLPQEFQAFQNLTHLALNGDIFPSQFIHLKKLISLRLGLETNQVPLEIAELKNLKELKLYFSQNVPTTIDSKIFNLPNLETLSIGSSWAVGAEIKIEGEDFSKLKNLKNLELTSSLLIIPKTINQLQSIEKLIIGCNTIPIELFELKNVKVLKFFWSLNQIEIERISQMKSIQHLSISNVKNIPKELSSLNLEAFHINGGREEYVTFSDELSKMNSLKVLKLSNIKNLKELPSFIYQLKNLEVLIINSCGKLTTIDDNILNLKSLKHLIVGEIYNFKVSEKIESSPVYMNPKNKAFNYWSSYFHF